VSFSGFLSSDQRASLKRLAACWSPEARSSFQYPRRTSSSALVGELNHVIRIDADHRLGRVVAGGGGVPVAHVQRDRPELGGALTDERLRVVCVGRRGRCDLGVEFFEEPIGCLLAGAVGAPHDLPALVVSHEREVVVLALPADLVDPDVVEAVQAVGIELVVADTLDDPPDRVPVDPQKPLDGGLVDASHQPRDEALEVAGELRAWAGERDALGPRPVLRAPQPPAAAVDLQPPDAEIEMAPDGVLRPGVLPRPARVPALRAHKPAATERDLHAHAVRLEPNIPDPDPRQTQKPGKCRRDAHVVLPHKL
jgi:hypothetical protein